MNGLMGLLIILGLLIALLCVGAWVLAAYFAAEATASVKRDDSDADPELAKVMQSLNAAIVQAHAHQLDLTQALDAAALRK